MTKKILGTFLALVLVFGGVASAAEMSISQDLYGTTSVRGTVSGFYGEIELYDDGNGEVEGLNFGMQARTESPFYGLAQINFYDSGDIGNPGYEYQSFELGGGAKFDALWGVNTGVEVTVSNPNLTNFGTYRPNVTVFASVDFCLFPSPQDTCSAGVSVKDTDQNESCWPCSDETYDDTEDN